MPPALSPPLPGKILKVKTKICTIWGILEANLKKCSTLKFMPNISFVSSICIHRSIILIFIEKSMLVKFFSWKVHFSTTYDFHFCQNPHFRDKFQALCLRYTILVGDPGYRNSKTLPYPRGMLSGWYKGHVPLPLISVPEPPPNDDHCDPDPSPDAINPLPDTLPLPLAPPLLLDPR